MIPEDREAILEEELIILRNSGEIPEIALHTTLYYLEEDEEGPEITLTEEELHQLHDAALARAREIVLRDLDPDNRDLGLYRGPARSIVNWRRLQNFSQRIGRQCHGFNNTVARALVAFMEREFADTSQFLRVSSVNCTAEDITAFCEELRMDTDLLPARWASLCRD
ncbi:MAG: hypothetical protein M8357_02535 [Desulfobulbaceae bacterium]|nr:hypothetical protein [Desulfobulbaceae bacterium]